jgi:hypothetical protein
VILKRKTNFKNTKILKSLYENVKIKRRKMSLSCVSCGKEAKYLCGHGCTTLYCGESCARDAYTQHKTECAVLVGGNSAKEILNRVSSGSIQQRFESLKREFKNLQNVVNQYTNLNWFQQRLNKPSVNAHIQAFLTAANTLYQHPNMSSVRNEIYNQIKWVQEAQPLWIKADIGEEEPLDFVGVDYTDRTTMWNYVNQGTPEQKYNNVQAQFNAVWNAMIEHSQSRFRAFNKGKITAYKDAFLAVAANIALQPAMRSYKDNIMALAHRIQWNAPKMIGAEEKLSEINEGAIDGLRDENAFFKYFNLNDASKRERIIDSTFVDLQDTYEAHKKDLFKGGLVKKLDHFVGALTRVQNERKDVSAQEKRFYADLINRVNVWKQSISRK